jgi:hypothetical protein
MAELGFSCTFFLNATLPESCSETLQDTLLREIYLKALWLLNMSGYKKWVRNLAVSVSDLIPAHHEQLEMFVQRSHAVAEAQERYIGDTYKTY